MASEWALPPEVVALVCDRSGMPWPMVWRTHIARAEPLPVVLTGDAVALLLRRLAVVMGLEPGGAYLYWCPEYQDWSLEVAADSAALPGIPEHVTDPTEAIAWGLCWWAMVQKLAIVLGTRPDGATEDWRVLARLAESFDLPLWTPLRDGVALEVADGE